MQKRLLRWELIGFAFTGAVGTLLHFVYEWTGGDPLIAAFCAVNESTWEHMKLLFVPFFLFTMVQFIVFAEPLRSFFAAKAASILLGLLAIPVLFYSLGGMFGKTPDWVNIAIFFLADALLYLMSFRLLTRGAPHPPPALAGSDEWPLRARRSKGRGINFIIWCSKEGSRRSGCPPCHCSVLPFSSASPAAPRR